MKKYVVSYDDNTIDVIFKNRADAEEYILSCAEENLYEEMLTDIQNNCSESPQEFIQSYADDFAYMKETRVFDSHICTLNGHMLYWSGNDYFIYEGEELD